MDKEEESGREGMGMLASPFVRGGYETELGAGVWERLELVQNVDGRGEGVKSGSEQL